MPGVCRVTSDRTTDDRRATGEVETVIVMTHALIGWGLCGALMGVAMSRTTIRSALVIHAVGAPLVFGLLSFIYFTAFAYTSPLLTAAVFTGVVIGMDAAVVAPFIEKSYDMFRSPLGTWIPFGLIFLTTWGVGLVRGA